MRSSKNRSRSKGNRGGGRPSGNIVNRVFDSSGPEGKVRGTPQQIIDKYQTLARDAQLAGDRVAVENFLQHAEHYTRMLSEANREMEEKRQQQEREQQARQEREREQREAREAERAAREAERQQDDGGQDTPQDDQSIPADAEAGPVDTPEDKPRRSRSRGRRKAEQPQGDQREGMDEVDRDPMAEPPEAAE